MKTYINFGKTLKFDKPMKNIYFLHENHKKVPIKIL